MPWGERYVEGIRIERTTVSQDCITQVFDKMMSTLENCCIREAISYHRLAGRTLFKFKGDRSCVRLETFYRKTYKESYYIFYEKDQAYHSDLIKGMRRSLVEHHTVPNFIHLSSIEKRHLPADFDVGFRYCICLAV